MPQLILLRHGESAWNLQNRFTGWVDVSLSADGVAEAVQAGEWLRDMRFDAVFTSALLRAQDTAYEVLKRNRHCTHYLRIHETGSARYGHYDRAAQDRGELVVHVSESLNERYYGDLQGLNKTAAADHFGAEQVHIWRRSYDVPPPNGESLKMTAERTLPYYHAYIEPLLRAGQTLLVTAHGNSLRALIMHLEAMTPEQILAYELHTGAPHVYDFGANLALTGKRILRAPDTAPTPPPRKESANGS
ncbi:2,3-bisphosphoglycerate-dependent phosphoglycerate mutase [Acidihalobacter ferrooxydans]|uniref:2,3-bisphosphoglycerate-dependent phosphoglycerate mutase n=1 Tax=Acidihalobacter ferrooxydans TaxID=1765967 RepID=A0A1P8UF50_9GAMM|nr:histidine phosphatase family protein [Acidihalobacter ferrooxydans]APZ42446.1 2,3-bisphosphoglycerate-dependent phosphoglycerate mutase [Acidihalobacter ferrooxydans]